jgi:DNA-binding response OmpR family regulator
MTNGHDMHSGHVLLVDDDILISLELHEFLKDSGFKVEVAYSGAGAIAAIERDPPWALVTDLDLGKGPNGFDVARCARSSRPGLPVVFVSGTMASRHSAEGVPGSGFVAKPFIGVQVLDALRRAIDADLAGDPTPRA